MPVARVEYCAALRCTRTVRVGDSDTTRLDSTRTRYLIDCAVSFPHTVNLQHVSYLIVWYRESSRVASHRIASPRAPRALLSLSSRLARASHAPTPLPPRAAESKWQQQCTTCIPFRSICTERAPQLAARGISVSRQLIVRFGCHSFHSHSHSNPITNQSISL